MKRMNHFLTEPQVKALTALSKKTGLTLAELIRRAIDAFLKSEGKS